MEWFKMIVEEASCKLVFLLTPTYHWVMFPVSEKPQLRLVFGGHGILSTRRMHDGP
jgi:hypothetical protein